jgi:hypothetical protein
VFFGTGNGRFFAVDQTGRQRWRVDNLTPVVGVPALRGGHVYVGTTAGKLYAFDTATGATRWMFQANSPITTSPVVGDDGTVYFGTQTKGLFALDAQGQVRWTAVQGARIDGAAPAIGPDGVIHVATTSGSVVALRPDGAEVWRRAITNRGAAAGSPTIGEGRIYVPGADGYLRALDAVSGGVLWAFQAAGPIGSGVSRGADGTLYFGAGDGRVYAVRDAGSHAEVRWTALLRGRVDSTPAVDRTGTVFVGSDDTRVYALEPSNGAVRWSVATGRAVQSAIAIGVGGRVFAGSGDRSLYAIGEFRSGADCWNDAFIDPTGLTLEEVTKRFQVLLAACGGPGISACQALVQGSVNADRFLAALRIASDQVTPAQYLAILRDRTRKLAALRAGGDARMCAVLGHDADGDLVPDALDACPGTPALTPTFDNGCPDPNLPEAPSADLIRAGLAKMNLLLDPRCDQTVPGAPALTQVALGVGPNPLDDPTEKEFEISFDNNQQPGCGVFYEMEIFLQGPGGTLQAFALVFPQNRGRPVGIRTLAFRVADTDPGEYGAMTRSKAFTSLKGTGYLTWYRLRATSYAGVRSVWGPLVCSGADC